MFDIEKQKSAGGLLTRTQQSNMSDSTRDGSSTPKEMFNTRPYERVSRKSLIEIPYVDDYLIAPYRIYFNVTTELVLERFQDSIMPLGKTPLFLESPVDLYGPLWIYFSLNIWIAIFGHICAYIDSLVFSIDAHVVVHMHKLSRCYALLAVYFFVIPALLNFLFFFTVSRYPGYTKLLAIYGYSFAIYIPATVLYLLPNDGFRWILLCFAGIISLFWICKEVRILLLGLTTCFLKFRFDELVLNVDLADWHDDQ